MKPHHVAWLAVHPDRSAAWLTERMRDGFDVHHLDGDHANNDPRNLVMIECSDHLMLHNGGCRISRINNLARFNQRVRQAGEARLKAYPKKRTPKPLSPEILLHPRDPSVFTLRRRR